jgi:hypothetical protein
MAIVPPVPYRSVIVTQGGLVEQLVWVRWLTALLNAVNQAQIAGTFANNVDALAGGLVVGQVYQTATGEMRVVV